MHAIDDSRKDSVIKANLATVKAERFRVPYITALCDRRSGGRRQHSSIQIHRFQFVPAPIGSQIEMRLVHIFEMREAKIAKETAFEMWKVVQG